MKKTSWTASVFASGSSALAILGLGLSTPALAAAPTDGSVLPFPPTPSASVGKYDIIVTRARAVVHYVVGGVRAYRWGWL